MGAAPREELRERSPLQRFLPMRPEAIPAATESADGTRLGAGEPVQRHALRSVSKALLAAILTASGAWSTELASDDAGRGVSAPAVAEASPRSVAP